MNDRRKSIVDNFVGFCEKTSLYGRAYSAKTNIYTSFWIATILLSLAFCSIFVKNSISSFMGDAQVLTTIDSVTYPVHKLPYPTLTVCPPEVEAPDVYDDSHFLRAAYNQFKLICYSPLSCKETAALRKDFATFLKRAGEYILKKTPRRR
jgi:hypothetical protein